MKHSLSLSRRFEAMLAENTQHHSNQNFNDSYVDKNTAGMPMALICTCVLKT
jgi:hypothetical protein